MNLLSKSDVFAENKLFATLDTTIRKVVINNQAFLLSDTVGFIRKLPHSLIESFKSTLDEVRESDILVHVADISHPDFEEQVAVVKQTLADLKAADKPTLMVFNKTDAYQAVHRDADDLTEPGREHLSLSELENSWMAQNNTPALFISALKRKNIDELRDMLFREVRKILMTRYPENQYYALGD
jgi:GTP-binding protein HflX